jgi:FMN-dependent NADH-azoreductase
MGTVLYIKANPKSSDKSRTFRISDKFIEAYQQKHPGDTIITLDLYKEDIKFLSEEDVSNHQITEKEKSHPVFKYAYQFMEADKYVFAEPLWNLGVPAILKAYFDYICVAGITFEYTAQGPVGLCKGKKAVNITTRGGDFSREPMAAFELGDRYIKTLLGFLGVTDYTAIVAENLDVLGNDVEAIVNNAIQEAEQLAASF